MAERACAACGLPTQPWVVQPGFHVPRCPVGHMGELVSDEAEALREQLELARAVIEDLVDPAPCRADDHGYCQTHGWLTSTMCPHDRAREVLRA